jgi:hypothetical protein
MRFTNQFRNLPMGIDYGPATNKCVQHKVIVVTEVGIENPGDLQTRIRIHVHLATVHEAAELSCWAAAGDTNKIEIAIGAG